MMELFPSFEKTLRCISDSQKPLSISQLYSLSGATRAEMTIFAQQWPRIGVERRRRIIRSLVELAEASFEVDFDPIFRHCLGDEDDQVRAQAIDGLWENEDTALIEPLVRLLKGDPSVVVRASAAMALGKYILLAELEELDEAHGARVRAALLETIRHPGEEVEVRRRAVESIAYAGDEEVQGIIEGAYYDDEEKMRVSAIFAMGRSADPRWRETVLMELDNPNPEMRFEAARACGELEHRGAVPTLIELIEDPDREVQGAAIWALGQIGGAEARRVLQACCLSEDEVVRDAAEEALDELEFGQGILSLPLYELDLDEEEDEIFSYVDEGYGEDEDFLE
ncbi:MAG: HEAT repeat domain-containing protein [Anaerolineae bacterium]